MLILSNVARLYDGTSAESSALLQHRDLGIEDGKVAFVRPHQPNADPGAPRVDASAWTVTPGLVDDHGHITILGLADVDSSKMESQQELLFVEKILHMSLVDGGVTTTRDIGGATDFMKRMVDEGAMIGPRLEIAICVLSSTGGHADFRGPDRCHGEVSKMWAPRAGRPSMIVDGPWECRKRVREIAACGADLIKVCTSPGVASPSDHLDHQEFTPEEIDEEIDAICSGGQRPRPASRRARAQPDGHRPSDQQRRLRHPAHLVHGRASRRHRVQGRLHRDAGLVDHQRAG